MEVSFDRFPLIGSNVGGSSSSTTDLISSNTCLVDKGVSIIEGGSNLGGQRMWTLALGVSSMSSSYMGSHMLI